MILREEGYTTRCAYNGIEVLALAKTNPEAALILDLHMPVMSGFEVLAQILPGSRPIPQTWQDCMDGSCQEFH